jgi:antitoxin (DNA-binding transcriptional repressor) of toxin-antitoxin stability system
MLDFRRDAEGVIRRVQQGKRMILTYRGKPVLVLEPVPQEEVRGDDPFYSIDELATREGAPLSNDDMDQVTYEI